MQTGVRPINADETILNVMLWKEGAKEFVQQPFDPYFGIFPAYLSGDLKDDRTYREYSSVGLEPTYHVFLVTKAPVGHMETQVPQKVQLEFSKGKSCAVAGRDLNPRRL